MRDVLTKEDFVHRFIDGEFGNRTPTWRTLDEVPGDDRALYCLRSLTPGAKTYYSLLYGTLRALWTPQHYVSAMIPPRVEESLVLQGEVMRDVDGWYCHCSRLAVPMKQALLEAPLHLYKTDAYFRLQSAMSPQSFDWLQYLLSEYQDHVVEFSTYAVDYGVLPGHNTLFWEVRKY